MASPTERATITLPAALVERIDRLEQNRSRFIAEAVERELARRQRERLLQSIRNPHGASAELADAGLAEWGASLPVGDDDFVDPNAGKARAVGRRTGLGRGGSVAVVPAKSGLTKASFALIDRLRSIDERRIRPVFGRTTKSELAAVDQGLLGRRFDRRGATSGHSAVSG